MPVVVCGSDGEYASALHRMHTVVRARHDGKTEFELVLEILYPLGLNQANFFFLTELHNG